jgi:hypothetical protein
LQIPNIFTCNAVTGVTIACTGTAARKTCKVKNIGNAIAETNAISSDRRVKTSGILL